LGASATGVPVPRDHLACWFFFFPVLPEIDRLGAMFFSAGIHLGSGPGDVFSCFPHFFVFFSSGKSHSKSNFSPLRAVTLLPLFLRLGLGFPGFFSVCVSLLKISKGNPDRAPSNLVVFPLPRLPSRSFRKFGSPFLEEPKKKTQTQPLPLRPRFDAVANLVFGPVSSSA